MRAFWIAACAAFGLVTIPASASPAAAQSALKAGVAAAVRGPVQQISYRTPEASIGRNVTGGDEVFLGDRIVTGPSGGVQILLLDGTTFSVGPNSSLVIDEFVYDPRTGAGKLTATVAKGTLRVISGKLTRQEQEAVRIKLPMATVGIRGTMVVLTGGPNGFFVGLFGIGANNSANRPQSLVFVYANGGGNGIFRAGFGCSITPANPQCDPKPVGDDFLKTLLGQIGGNVRYVDIVEFERLTGLDLVTALKLLQTQGGFEDLWILVDKINQDKFRPGTPPSLPPCTPYCSRD